MSFDEALQKTLQHEGGWANDPADRGGETFRGISRLHWPGWPGWPLIDQAKEDVAFPGNLYRENSLSAQLYKLAAEYYRTQFWSRLRGDDLPGALAAAMFDAAVNHGVHRAGMWLQQSLNVLNRNGQSWPELVEDGSIGPGTLKVLTEYVRQERDPGLLLKTVALFRGAFYLDLMRRSPTQERFARGWLARVSI